MTRYFSILTILLFSFLQSQESKIFMDKNWKITTENNAAFYRIQKKTPIESIVYNADYFINGNIQNQWYSTAENLNHRIGSSFWYKEDGTDDYESFGYPDWNDDNIKKYKGLELKFYYPDGKSWLVQKLDGHKSSNKLHSESGKLITELFKENEKIISNNERDSKDEKNKIIRQYWQTSGKVATEKQSVDDNVVRITYYNQDGTLLNNYSSKNIVGGRIFDQPDYHFVLKNGFVTETKMAEKNVVSVSNVLTVNDINYISKGTYPSFFGQNTQTSYSFQKLYSKENNQTFSILDESVSRATVFSESQFYKVSDVKSQNVSDLKNQLKNKAFETESSIGKFRYFFLTPEILVKQELSFRNDVPHGFGSVFITDDNDVKKWRTDRSSFYSAQTINLNGEKPIIFAADQILIVPTNKGCLLNGDPLNPVDLKTIYSNYGDSDRMWYFFNYLDFYSIKKINNKDVLVDTYQKELFRADNIEFNSKFIVTEDAGKVKIYNHFLEDITPEGIQSAFLYPNYVNVLADHKVSNINNLGQAYSEPSIQTIECGTGRCSTHKELLFNKKNLQFNTSTSCDSGTFYEEVTFANIESGKDTELITSEKIKDKSFLKKFPAESYLDYFIVNKNGKYGLFAYDKKAENILQPEKVQVETKPAFMTSTRTIIDKKTKKKRTIVDRIPLVIDVVGMTVEDALTKKITVNAAKLLDVDQDEIKFQDGYFIFKKNDVSGIFPTNTEGKYLKIGERKDNYIEITDTQNHNGWLDLSSGKEFYNN